MDTMQHTIKYGTETINLHISFMRITPEKARELLLTTNVNRNLHKANLERIKRDIMENEFYPTIDPIRISSKGELIDGQHRLNAIIDTATTQTILVVKGFPERAYYWFDQIKNRTAADNLKVQGLSNSKETAACYNVIWRFINGIQFKNSNPSSRELRDLHDVLSTTNDIQEDLLFAIKQNKSQKNVRFRITQIAVMRWLLSNIYPRKNVESFFNQFIYGTDNVLQNDTHPATKLRNRLTDDTMIDLRKGGGTYYMSYIYEAWKKHNTNKALIKWSSVEQQLANLRMLRAETKEIWEHSLYKWSNIKENI